MNKVLLGLSGGVDSTAAALLLKEKGFEVSGLYFDVLGNNRQGKAAAEKAAAELGIDFIYKDVSKIFEEIVIADFCGAYMKGKTPNPCVLCNPAVKFKTLLEEADRIGAYFVATGHYAKVKDAGTEGSRFIAKATNEQKDQSYMLYRLSQAVLNRLLLPLGDFESKTRVRSLVSEENISNADLKDSQEICFIPKQMNYINFIMSKSNEINPGNFIDKTGKVLGRHQGLIHYTIGQRKGLGLTFGKPVFVTKLNPLENTVVLGENEDLFTREVFSHDHWFPAENSGKIPDKYDHLRVTAKIRYTARPAEATIYKMEDGFVKTIFKEAQRAVTPGQSIVFYLGDQVIGGGIIR